ncbi:MAG TPA: pitrilysin family protein [Chitinophagales bacterium]|nr:pitrilysin family protein [Chitinophagales bacterium]
MIDRRTPPPLQPIRNINLPAWETTRFANGVTAHVVDGGTQDVIKVEMIFPAGRWHEPTRGVAAAVAAQLKEGTRTKTALEVANLVDFYGASISTHAYIDYASVSLYTLTKHLQALLPLMRELLSESVFPQHELAIFKSNSIQKLSINEQKVEFRAQRLFTEVLYGKQHPIGYTTSKEDFEALQTGMLVTHRNNTYDPHDCIMIVSGKVKGDAFKLIEQYLGTDNWSNPQRADSVHEPVTTNGTRVHNEPIDGAVQSALRVGKRFINKLHPDYPAVKCANLVLGEYFGSRLMSNLREDKGYCYGIHSSIASFLHDGYLLIASEVGADVTDGALKEINTELERLQQDLVPADELDAARNYRLGTLLGDLDGPFSSADLLKGLLLFGLGKDYFNRYVETVQTITPQQIRDAAQQYFHPDSMITAVAGSAVREAQTV